MAEQWQIRRGTTAENNNFTGAVGELTMDTTAKGLRIHDGATQGGIQIPTATTADYVVETQAPTALNNYTWYRKYKSGWIEQGGFFTGLTQGSGSWANTTVSLPITMSDTNYTVTTSGVGIGAAGGSGFFVKNLTTSGFSFYYLNASGDAIIGWTAIGFSA